MGEPLVTVIVPAFNAALTITRTLLSALAQTHRNIEIIVVDDGSADATAALVERAAAMDSRVRLIRTTNQGVAAARNLGIARAQAEFLAFLDADDLWHEYKIERQLARLMAGPADMAFVYSPYRAIDEDDHVCHSQPLIRCEGWAFAQHLAINFVGNGSAILARKHCVQAVGGFDSALREVGAEGCEDILFQLKLAARFRIGMVPEYLVGYRISGPRLSANRERMFRSRRLVDRVVQEAVPDAPVQARRWNLSAHRLNHSRYLFGSGRWFAATRMLLAAAILDPAGVFDRGRSLATRKVRQLVRAGTGRPESATVPACRLAFHGWRPDELAGEPIRALAQRRLARLEALDQRRGAYQAQAVRVTGCEIS